MTIYNVYIHRDIRLTFEGVEAQTPEFALRIARDGLTSDADDIDESGEDLSASVEVDGDEDHGRSVTIDFEAERLRKTAPALLDALQETLSLLDGCMRNAERLGQPEFAARIGTMISVNRDAIAEATAAGQEGDRP